MVDRDFCCFIVGVVLIATMVTIVTLSETPECNCLTNTSVDKQGMSVFEYLNKIEGKVHAILVISMPLSLFAIISLAVQGANWMT